MQFGEYSYLITTALVAGAAISIEYVLGWRWLWKQRRVIGIMAIVGLLAAAVGEPTALRWRAWTYLRPHTLYTLFLGAEVETYFFSLMVAIAVASATLAWSVRYEEKNLPLISSTWKELKEKITAAVKGRRGRP